MYDDKSNIIIQAETAVHNGNNMSLSYGATVIIIKYVTYSEFNRLEEKRKLF